MYILFFPYDYQFFSQRKNNHTSDIIGYQFDIFTQHSTYQVGKKVCLNNIFFNIQSFSVKILRRTGTSQICQSIKHTLSPCKISLPQQNQFRGILGPCPPPKHTKVCFDIALSLKRFKKDDRFPKQQGSATPPRTTSKYAPAPIEKLLCHYNTY